MTSIRPRAGAPRLTLMGRVHPRAQMAADFAAAIAARKCPLAEARLRRGIPGQSFFSRHRSLRLPPIRQRGRSACPQSIGPSGGCWRHRGSRAVSSVVSGAIAWK